MIIKLSKIRKEWRKLLDLIYPQICGICGKITPKSLCNKCEIELKNLKDVNIVNQGKDIEGKYFNELMYVFEYKSKIRKLILDYKFNEKSYLY